MLGPLAMTALVIQTVSLIHIGQGTGEKRGLTSGAIVWLLLLAFAFKLYLRM